MTSVEKITVSLPAGQVAAARRAVEEGRAPSVSAYVSAGLDLQEQREALAVLVDEWLAEDGRPPEEAYAWADAVLEGGSPRTERPRRVVGATVADAETGELKEVTPRAARVAPPVSGRRRGPRGR